MTRELFREDAYLRHCKAQVVAVHPPAAEGQGCGVELDATVFTPWAAASPAIPARWCLRMGAACG